MILQIILPTLEQIITETIVLIIVLLIGFSFMGKYAKKRNWENSYIVAIAINFIWFIINLFLGILTYQLFSIGFIIDSILVVINIFVGSIIAIKFLKTSLKEALTLTIITQIVLFAVTYILNEIPNIISIFAIEHPLYEGSKLTFIFSLIIIVAIMSFIMNWGDKIQLIETKNIILLLSILPGIYSIVFAFTTLREEFYLNLGENLILAFIISITLSFVLKKIAYRSIKYEELRELVVLEKGKHLLTIKDLKVYYPLLAGMLKRQVGAVKAVNGVSFEIKTGETFGLVGESGCGKTTIANAILGLIEKTDGDIFFHNEPIPDEFTGYLRQKIQIVFQDPDASLNPRFKIVDIIAEPLKNILGITDKNKIRSHVLKLLQQVSLKREHMDRYPHEFSGGQKQRIIIARALACNPELIILDEPTSALDVSVQAQILNLLKDLQETYGYGFLFITHNLAVVNHIADRIGVMYLGKIVEIGLTEQIFLNPTHPYTQALLASRSEIDPENQEISFVISGEVPSPINPPPGCTFNPRCVSDARTAECEVDLPHKIKIGKDHYIWCVNPPVGFTPPTDD
ncbi:MAG: oligopeptide/dipeptide ABC transporter ATP-binding protein, partial [Promethearchaeota archaeon]